MCAANEFLRYVTDQRMVIDQMDNDLKDRIIVKVHQLSGAQSDDPRIPDWKAEMKSLQEKRVAQPNTAVYSLLEEIHRKTGLSKAELIKRNDTATNHNLKGAEWAKFVLDGYLPSNPR